MNPPLLSLSAIRLALPDRALIAMGSLVLEPGQRLGIMGQSGTGKSSLALALLDLLPPSFAFSADAQWEGGPAHWKALRGHAIGYIAQQPDQSFHPTIRLGQQLHDVLRIHAPDYSPKGRQARIEALLTFVELPTRVLRAYVHELSGGELQRLAIVQTLLPNPRLIIADEPTTALDPHTERQVLQLLQQLTTVNNCALLTISHDPQVHAILDQPVMRLENQQLHAPTPLGQLLEQDRYTLPSQALATAPNPNSALNAIEGRTPVLELNSLSFAYRSKPRLPWQRGAIQPPLFEGLSAEVHQGQTLGIVGASGAGKSTLLRLIAGVALPTAGSVAYYLDGQAATLDQLRHAGKIQWVFQHSRASLPPHLTVGAVLSDALRHANRSTRELPDLLAAVQLPPEYAARRPDSLSGGELQRISLARALAYRPALLLLDEPTASLDTTTQAAIIDLLLSLQATYGIAYVWVSHQQPVIAQVADRVLRVGR